MAVGATNLFLMLSSKTHNPPREFGHKPHIIPKWLDSHHFTHFYSSCIALRASSTGFNSHIFVDQQQLATCNCDHKANFENWTWHHALLNSALHLWLWVTSTCSWCWAQKPTTHIEKFGHNPLFTPSNHPALPVNHFVQVQLDSIGYISHISVDHQQLACYWILIQWLTYSWCWAQKTRDRLRQFGIQVGRSRAKCDQHVWTSLETWSASLTGNMTTGRYEVGFFTSASFFSASPSTDTARTWRLHLLLFSPM